MEKTTTRPPRTPKIPEGTLEKIEEAAKVTEIVKVAKLRQLNSFLRRGWVLPTATAVGGTVIGYVVGYMRTRGQYDEIEAQLESFENQVDLEANLAEREDVLGKSIDVAVEVTRELTAQAQEVTKQLSAWKNAVAPLADNEVEAVAVSARINEGSDQIAIRSERVVQPTRLRSMAPKDDPVVKNVFDDAGDEWDYAVELESRSGDEPYTIHVDEYVADEMGWNNQSTLTWYEADKILCDSRDTPIYNPGEFVGELHFGHGSKDPNVVYIRNPKLQAEFEVLRDPGSYQQTVMGEAIEADERKGDLKHSQSPRKFRRD